MKRDKKKHVKKKKEKQEFKKMLVTIKSYANKLFKTNKKAR